MTRILPRAVLVALLTVVSLLGVESEPDVSGAAAGRIEGSLRLSVDMAEPGATITARGRIAPRVKRRVVLQRSVDGSWRKVAVGRSSRRGRYTFVTTLPGVQETVVRYRVHLPRRTRRGMVLPRRFTPTDSVTTTGAVSPPAEPPPTEQPPPTEEPPPTQDPPAGPVLVAGWEMNEPSGRTQMADASGRGHHGAISPNAAAAGLTSNGSSYDWSQRCRDCPPVALARIVQVPDSPDLEIRDPATPWSLELRFRTTAPYGNLMQKGQSGTSGGQIKVEDPSGLRCVFTGADGRRALVAAPRPLNDGLWHTVACVHTATSISQWVDGVLVARVGVSVGRIDNSAPFVIGGKTLCDQRSVGCDYYSGSIDWARIVRG